MEPAGVSARVFVSPSLFHQKFPHDPPDVSFLRIPAKFHDLKKKVDLTCKILFHDGEIRPDSERTPLSSTTQIGDSDVTPVKKRRLEFVPVRKNFDWPPRTLVKTARNNECSEKLSSSAITAAVDESVQLTAHKEGNNEFNGLWNSADSNPDEGGGETSCIPFPGIRGSTLRGEQDSCFTESHTGPSVQAIGAESAVSAGENQDPAEALEAELPKPPLVTSNESQVVNDKNLSVNHSKPPDRIHNPDMLEQSSNKSESQDLDVAKNLTADGSEARDAIMKPSINEVVGGLSSRVHPSSEEIPTVVQEFTGARDSKRRNKRKHERSTVVKRPRREAPDSVVTQVSSFAQMTGGKVTVNSTLNNRGPHTAPSGQVQSVGHSERPVSIGRVDDCCVPPYADFLEHSKSLCGSYGYAAGCAERSTEYKTSAETPQICHPEVIHYSASYLRSLVPYRPEGFNSYPHMKFKCVFCSHLFPCLDDLQGHVDRHHYGNNPYECPFCLERFEQISTYSGHLNQHIQLRDYPTFGCQFCSASFSSTWELHLHAIAHGHHFSDVPRP